LSRVVTHRLGPALTCCHLLPVAGDSGCCRGQPAVWWCHRAAAWWRRRQADQRSANARRARVMSPVAYPVARRVSRGGLGDRQPDRRDAVRAGLDWVRGGPARRRGYAQVSLSSSMRAEGLSGRPGLVRGRGGCKSLHWLHDTLYQEDKSQVRTRSGPWIMAALPGHLRPAPVRTHRHHRGHPMGQPVGSAIRHPRPYFMVLKRPWRAGQLAKAIHVLQARLFDQAKTARAMDGS
jgi:hypothetical protein